MKVRIEKDSDTTIGTLRCKYWDCGWCYAPSYLDTNKDGASCMSSSSCKEFKKQREEFSLQLRKTYEQSK